MSAHELTLRLRFVSTDAMVAFLSKPPAGVQIIGNNGEVAAGRTRTGGTGHTAKRWTAAEDEILLDTWTGLRNGSTDGLTNEEARTVAAKLNRTANSVRSRLNVLLTRG